MAVAARPPGIASPSFTRLLYHLVSSIRLRNTLELHSRVNKHTRCGYMIRLRRLLTYSWR